MQEQSRQARETQKALAAYGIPSEIVSWSQSNAGGITTTMQGEASTLADGTVFIKNDAGILEDGTTEYTPREMAGHEMAHAAQRRTPAEYQAYYDALTDGNIDFSNETFLRYYSAIEETYFVERGKPFDFTQDYPLLYDEFAAFVSGSILNGEASAVQEISSMFYDFDSVVEAWKRMESAMRRQGGQSTTQAGSGKTESAFLDTSARGDNIDALIRDVFGYSEGSGNTGRGVDSAQEMSNTQDAVAMSQDEQEVLYAYKSSESYKINDKLRGNEPLNAQEQQFVELLDSAIEKLPVFRGEVYRNLVFDDFGGKSAFDAFMEQNAEGYYVAFSAYSSASTAIDGYPVEGTYTAHMIMQSERAHDVEGFGNNFESEVVFARDSLFFIEKVTTDEMGTPTIYAREVVADEKGEYGQLYPAERGDAVHDVRTSYPPYTDLQGISGWDSEGNIIWQSGSQQTVSGRQRHTEGTDQERITDGSQKAESAFLDSSARGDNIDALIRDVFGYGERRTAGKLHFDGDRSALTFRQKASVNALEVMADALGLDIYVYESGTDGSGRRTGANGWYDPKDSSIHLDLYAGANGEGTMLFTAAHELTHFIRQWSPAKFETFADFLFSEYGQKGIAVDALIRAQMEKAKRNGRTIDYDTAYEEVVADSCETMLADGSLVERLAKLKAADRTLWQKIKDFIDQLVSKIRKAYAGLSPDSAEGKYVAQMQDAAERLQALFSDALEDAGAAHAGNRGQKNTAENGGVKYQLIPYTEHQKENWAESKSIVVYENQAQLEQFIDDALNKKNLDKKMYFGSVPLALAERVMQETGVDVDGYNCTLRAKEIRKILLYSHGNEAVEALRGQRAITKEDIVLIPEIIQNPDQITLSPDLYEGKPAIHFVKTINGKTTVVAYVSKKHLDLTVQTMYAGKNKGNLATAAGDQAPANTPEAHVGTVPNITISQTDTDVNNQSMQEDTKYSDRDYSYEALTSKPDMTVTTLPAGTLDEQAREVFAANRMRSADDNIDAIIRDVFGYGERRTAGKLHFDGDRSALTFRQKASLNALEIVADVLGVDIYVYESGTDGSGRRTGANGWYDPKDSSIHLDLYAGANGEGTMLFTAAHELTHFIRQWSPAKFETFADFLFSEYGQKGIAVDALIRAQMEKAKRNGRTIDYDTAYEEVVADSCETMLADGSLVERLAKLKAADRTLWQKIKDFIDQLVSKIRKAYAGLSPDSAEGKYVAQMQDAAERLQALFSDALEDAGDAYAGSRGQKNTAENGGVKYSIHDDATGRYVQIDVDQHLFDGKTVTEMQNIARNYILQGFRNKAFPVGTDGKAFVNRTSANEYAFPANRRMEETIKESKMRASTELQNLLEVSRFLRHETDDGRHAKATGGWDIYETTFQVGGKRFTGEVKIMVMDKGYLFYDITKIKELPVIPLKSEQIRPTISGSSVEVGDGELVGKSALPKDTPDTTPPDTTVSQTDTGVNNQSMQEGSKYSAASGDVKYSIRYTTDNRPVAVIDENILEGVPRAEWINKVKQTISEKFSDGIPVGGRLVRVNLKTRNEYTKSKDSQKLETRAPIIYQDKFQSAGNLDEIVLASTNYVNEDLKHERKDNFKEFARGDVLIRVGEKDYSAQVIIGFTTGNQMVLYDVINFTPTNIALRTKKEGTQFAAQSQNREQSSSNVPSNITVSQTDTGVNNQSIEPFPEKRTRK